MEGPGEEWGIPGPERLRVCPVLGPLFFFFKDSFIFFVYSGSPLHGCFYLFASTRAYTLVAVCGLLIAVASPFVELRL